MSDVETVQQEVGEVLVSDLGLDGVRLSPSGGLAVSVDGTEVFLDVFSRGSTLSSVWTIVCRWLIWPLAGNRSRQPASKIDRLTASSCSEVFPSSLMPAWPRSCVPLGRSAALVDVGCAPTR